MNKFFRILLTSLFIVSSACSTTHLVEVQAGVKDIGHLYESVGLVNVEEKGNPLASATAFAYDKDHLLTAAHVCLTALELQIFVTRQESLTLTYTNAKGEIKKVKGIDIEDISATEDICMLRRPDHGLRPVVLAPDLKSTKVRDDVVIVGAPLGVAIGEFPGKVMDLSSNHAEEVLKGKLIVSSAATGGVSGSPVFDAHGRVIGILVMGPMFFDHLSICVGINHVQKFLKENGYVK